MADPGARLGKVQLQIMQVLWQRGAATAREITAELAEQAPIAHSTVQTLLRKMETKGVVTHEVLDRTFVFKPTRQRSEITTTATRDLLTRLFDRSVSGLVAHLLQHEKISRAEMKRLRQLIEEADRDA